MLKYYRLGIYIRNSYQKGILLPKWKNTKNYKLPSELWHNCDLAVLCVVVERSEPIFFISKLSKPVRCNAMHAAFLALLYLFNGNTKWMLLYLFNGNAKRNSFWWYNLVSLLHFPSFSARHTHGLSTSYIICVFYPKK